MKILYIAPYLSGGRSLGARAKISLVCAALGKLGHDVTVLSSAVGGETGRLWQRGCAEDVAFGGIRCRVVIPGVLRVRPLGGLLNIVRAPMLGRKMARDYNPDVILCYNSYSFEYLAASAINRITGAPVILEVEDLPLARRRGLLNIKPALDQMAWPKMLRLASASTAVSGEIYDLLRADRPRVLFPGAIADELLQSARLRREPFEHDGPLRVGYFGSLTDGKGCDRLLETIRQASRGIHFVVSGNGPLAAAFADLSQAQPDLLSYLGVVPSQQLYGEMCSCDVCLVPAERVGAPGVVFPFKVFEYVASGSHVVAAGIHPDSTSKLGLSFIQQWDGTVADFFRQISSAKQHYLRTVAEQRVAVDRIRREFSVAGVSSTLARLLDGVTYPAHAARESVVAVNSAL